MLGRRAPAVAAEGARRWVLDPVDGTHNYARGIPVWCAAVALARRRTGRRRLRRVRPGARRALQRPRGASGAALDGAALRVGGEAALGSASVAMFVDARRRDPEVIGAQRAVAARVGSLRCLGCGSIELAYVAAGRIDAWLQPDSEPWDWNPGALLVREAGGVA